MNAFKTACQLMTRFRFADQDWEPPNLWDTVPFIPVVGALLGVAAWALALVLVWVTGPILGPVIGAIAIPLLLWWAQAGHGIKGLIWFLEEAGGPRDQGAAAYVRISVFQLLLLLKFVAVGYLIHSNAAIWLVLVPVLSAAVFAELELPGPALQGSDDDGAGWYARMRHWLVAALVTVVVAVVMKRYLPALMALVLAWLAGPAMERWVAPRTETRSPVATRAAAELVHLAMLLVGVLYVIAS